MLKGINYPHAKFHLKNKQTKKLLNFMNYGNFGIALKKNKKRVQVRH